MDMFLPAIIVLLIGIVISRFISEAGLKRLTQTQKAELIDSLAPIRKYGLLGFLIAVLATYQFPVLLLGVVVLYVLISHGLTFVKLHQLGLPAPYTRTVAAATIVSVLAYGIFIYLIWNGTAA